MIAWSHRDGSFLLRVAGVLIHDGKVLMQRSKSGDAWVLPGGRAEWNEPTEEAVIREFAEELGMCVRPTRLVWLIENFNAYRQDGLHEFGVYYEVYACPGEQIDIPDGEFIGKEAAPVLTFRWIELEQVPDTVIYPAGLKRLLRSIGEFRHIVNDDRKEYGIAAADTVEIEAVQELELESIGQMVQTSAQEGYRHIARLADEYRSGINQFRKRGEALFVAKVNGNLAGICGLNKQTSAERRTGRVRRMYVLPAYRRQGVGKQLVESVIDYARGHYDDLILYTDSKRAADFYTALGFAPTTGMKHCTHLLHLNKPEYE
ncbi:GNAT family N-acetyltransferase [Paenibacillus thiaminolyticus]|uniref:GNAT family N-acetyltransferase n=1 Tax=Paenibacillus thiaminolyticus TaxID=49283 RepID=UPI003D2E2631